MHGGKHFLTAYSFFIPFFSVKSAFLFVASGFFSYMERNRQYTDVKQEEEYCLKGFILKMDQIAAISLSFS